MFTAKENMSNVWRGITDNVQWIKKGSAVAIDNGKKTMFWDHCWATDSPLRSLATETIPDSIDGAIVEELWDKETAWKWDLFANILPNQTLKLIASHKVVEDTDAEDVRYWKGSKTGDFSVKYAMNIMRDDELPPSNPKWGLVWKAPVQQRIRVFMWLILHDRVLCNLNRARRHLTEDPKCKRCNNNQDESLHLLRDCPTSRNIWASVGGSANYPSFFIGDTNTWLIRNIKAEELIHSEKWTICFALTIWWCWKWRNCSHFGRKAEIPIDAGAFIRGKVDETWEAMFTGDNFNTLLTSPNSRKEVLIRWLAPPTEWIMLNTNGAAKGTPGQAGGGGVLRDCSGRFVRGFAARFGVCNAFKAEIWAAEIGLAMAKEMNITKLVLQLDNQACVEALKNQDYQGGECCHILKKCRTLINDPVWEIKIVHCYREGNLIRWRTNSPM